MQAWKLLIAAQEAFLNEKSLFVQDVNNLGGDNHGNVLGYKIEIEIVYTE